MGRLLLATFAAALLVAAAAQASPQRETAATARVTGWADRVLKNGVPPKDAVRAGTLCKPVAFKRLYAFITFRGMKNKIPSSATWFYGDEKVYTFKFPWEDGARGRTAFSIYPVRGTLEAGRYTIEIRWSAKLVARGSVTLKFGDC